MNTKNKKVWSVFRFIFVALPLFLAVYGYFVVEGMPFWEAVYAAAALYFVNPVNDAVNIYIIIAEIGALIVTLGFLAIVVPKLFYFLRRVPLNIVKGSTAIYSDNDLGKLIDEKWKKSVSIGDEDKAVRATNHVVMFSDDIKNLEFVKRNERKLTGEGRNVYVLLNEIDPMNLDIQDNLDIHFFNTNDLIAHDLWKKKDIPDKDNIEIAILNYNKIGQAVFKYGYMTMLYSVTQKVTYHIYGASASDAVFLEELNTGNDDSIVVHEGSFEKEYRTIAAMDMIILTGRTDTIDIIQKIVKYNENANISYYEAENTSIEKLLKASNLSSFGRTEDIFTPEAIQKEMVYYQGMLFNYDYNHSKDNISECTEEVYKEAKKEWNTLTGFYKGANIYRAEQYRIRKKIDESGRYNGDELNRIEHIRWSRYYYYNGWTKADAASPDNKKLKKHHLLIPFDELPDNEKDKDGFFNPGVEKEINRLIDEGV